MWLCTVPSPPHSLAFSKPAVSNNNNNNSYIRRRRSSTCRCSASADDVPDFLSAHCMGVVFCSIFYCGRIVSIPFIFSRSGRHKKPNMLAPQNLIKWLESRRKRPFGPRLNFSAEEAVHYQLDALMFNDQPRQDYGIEVMYRFAGFDPFERSTYFGPFFDLGQFERFRRIFHHSTYRVLLGHRERNVLSSLLVEEVNKHLRDTDVVENRYKQRIWIRGARPEEEGTFEFTMVQRVGGSWDGYWLTESLLNDGDSFSGGVAY